MALEGKVALVTGAARGIGKGIALGLAQAGADVVLSDLDDPPGNWSYELSNTDQLEASAKEVGQSGGRVLAFPCDVTRESDGARLVAATREVFGKLDIVVNNAGVVHFGPLVEFEEARWQQIFDVNVKGVFLVSKAAIPSLIESRGAIVNIASIAGKHGAAGGTAYCGSKFAVVGLTQSLALELAPQGVRVNAVCPGILATAMWNDHLSKRAGALRGLSGEEAYEQVVTRSIPLGREQTPADIAGAVVYLAEAENVTGVSLNVAGGLEVW